MFKNTANQKVTVFAFDYSTGAPKTGDAANLTLYVSKDDGAVTVLADTSATELSSTNAPGNYSFDLAQDETNADKLVFTGKSSTANVSIVPQTIYTTPIAVKTVYDTDFSTNYNTTGTCWKGQLQSGVAHSGTSLTLTGGVTITQSTTDTPGISITGNGTGAGLYVEGPSANGFVVKGGTNSIFLDIGTGEGITGSPTPLHYLISGNIGGNITSVTTAANLTTNNDKTGYQLSATGVDDIWDESLSGHTTAGTAGKVLSDAATAAGLTTVEGKVDTIDGIVDSILVDTAEIGVAGAGLTALAPAATALSTATWTDPLAGYLDKLNITGNVASSNEVTAIQNNTRIVFIVPEQLIRPSSGTTTIYVRVYLYDEIGQMETPDSAPTIELRNAAGTDLTSRLVSATGTNESTGVYRWSYTSSSTDDLEQILWSLTVIEGGNTRMNGRTSWVADTYTTDFTSSDRTTLNNISNYVDSIPADVWAHGTRTLTGYSDGSGFTAIPWNDDWDAEVQSECADALTAYDPPTHTEMTTAFTEIKGATWDSGTDTLEHIRNKETDIETDTQDIQGRLPAALVSGRMDSSVGSMASNTLTASAVATDAVNKIQNGLATATALTTVEGKVDTVDTVVDAIKLKTDGLPADPADASEIASEFDAVNTKLDTIDDLLDTEVAAIKAKTDLIPASPAAVGSAMTLTSGERDSIAAALLDLANGVETGVTPRNALRYIASAVAGVLSGAGGTGSATVTIKAIGDAGTTRLTVETDEDGNRTSVTLG